MTLNEERHCLGICLSRPFESEIPFPSHRRARALSLPPPLSATVPVSLSCWRESSDSESYISRFSLGARGCPINLISSGTSSDLGISGNSGPELITAFLFFTVSGAETSKRYVCVYVFGFNAELADVLSGLIRPFLARSMTVEVDFSSTSCSC